MDIIRCRPEHAAALTSIAFAAKRHWGYPEHWIQNWSESLTIDPEFIAKHDTFAAADGERTIGFYALVPKEDRVELAHLWVSPAEMARGIGRSLFLHAIERARAGGFRELQIESDPHAAGFYERLGACPAGWRISEVDHQRRDLPIYVYALRDQEP
jgi:GNAT superfamily N-acetyltransferase